MTAQTKIITALLKHTADGPAINQIIAQEANVPLQVAQNILSGLYEFGLIEPDGEQIELSSNQRVKLALYAITQGTDVESVCKVLEWKEFENFTAQVLEKNNFVVKRNFRFKAAQRRWEIDVVAYKEPFILCIDCKRWRRGWSNSAIKRVAAEQAKRTQVFASSLHLMQQKLDIVNWAKATIFPAILSLFLGPVKFYNDVPVVPILQIQNFVDNFLGYQTELAHYHTKIGPKMSDYFDDDKKSIQ